MQEYTTQVWLVFLMSAAYKAGLCPVPKSLFHRMIFLSNCMAPLFETTPTSATIIKFKRGPFYPVLQWYLDRLAVLGILHVRDMRYFQDGQGKWMDAKYGPTQHAWKIVDICKITRYGGRLEDYLTEMVFAMASLDRKTWNDAALRDSTYNAPGKSEGAFISFASQDENLSVVAARAFRDVVPRGLIVSPKEEMFLYMRFLEKQVGVTMP